MFFLLATQLLCCEEKSAAQINAPDTVQIKSLNDLSFKIRKEFPDSAFHLAEQAIMLSGKINYLPGLGDGYIRMGLIEKDRGNYDQALNYYRSSLFYRLRIGNQDYIARVYSNIGIVYTYTGTYDSAIYYSLKACKSAESLGLKKAQADYTMNLGIAYTKNKDYEKAIECYRQASGLFESLNDAKGIMQCEINLGSLYYNVGDYRNLLLSSYSAYARAQQLNDAENKNIALGNIALAYQETNQPDSAIYFIRMTLAANEFRQDKRKIAIDLSNIGIMFNQKKEYDSTIHYMRQSYELSKVIGELALLSKNCDYLANAYRAKGNYEQAFLYQKEFQLYQDSVFSLSKASVIAEMETKYETEKKEQAILLLNKDKEIQQLQINRQQDEIQKSNLIAEQERQKNTVQALTISSQQSALKQRELEATNRINELKLLNQDKEIQAGIIKEQKLVRDALLAIAALILLTGGLYISRIRLKQKEKTLEEHKRISSDLHDDIGATLSSFSLTSEVIKSGIKRGDTQEAVEAVEAIGSESRELMDRLSDIVWAINPRNDSFEKIISRLHAYAQKMCAGKNIGLQFLADDALNKIELPMEVRNNYFLIVKEAVNNAVKYSGCSQLAVHFKLNGKSIAVNIADNGKGFDMTEAREGNGLRNMKQRAEDIRAAFQLNSSPASGTQMTLSLAS